MCPISPLYTVYPHSFRSRAENPITAWYREQADGLVKRTIDGGAWVVLWRGLEPTEIPLAVEICERAPPDFST